MTLLVALSVLLGALAQSVSGIGFALVCAPLLVAALGPRDGVSLSLALGLVLNAVLLARDRRHLRVRDALLLLLPAAAVTPLFARLVREVPERPATALAGGLVVVAAAVLASGVRWHAVRGRVGAAGAGVVSAGMTVLAAASGPPVALWAANADWPPEQQRATLQLYFLGLNLVTVPSLGLPDAGPELVAACLVALATGLLLGAPLARRVSDVVAQRATLGLAGAGGLVVLASALTG